MLRRQLVTGLLMTVVLTVLLGFVYPLVVTGISEAFMGNRANGSVVKVNGKVVGSSLIGQSFADAKGNPIAKYFQPRPSATSGSPYNGLASGGSNLGPSNPLLIGFVPGVNTVGLDGNSSKTNPFATKQDPNCVPLDDQGNPVTTPTPGTKYTKTAGGSYACDPNTVPERVLAYRTFNHLAANAEVPSDAVTASGSGLDPAISLANARLQASRVAQARGVSVDNVNQLIAEHTQSRQWGVLGEQTVNVLELNLALDRM
jgi:K+-transporting ATPase ATPase C chain